MAKPLPRRSREQHQRTLLPPGEAPRADFVQAFKASHSLSKALAADRTAPPRGGGGRSASPAPGAGAAAARAVEAARRRPPPPPEAQDTRRRLEEEVRRDAADHAPTAAPEAPAQREQRQQRQEAFLGGRKERHDAACAAFERRLDALADACQAEAQATAETARRLAEEADEQADQMLHPLEAGAEGLGERDEEEVQGVLRALEALTERRRRRVGECCRELEAVDCRRAEEGRAELARLAQELTEAAHVVEGEMERLVEERSLQLNAVLVENLKSVKTLETKLQVQALERSKANKLRWHQGHLLWKQQRHRHTMEQVRLRIASDEFRQPPPLVEVLERAREQQHESSEARAGILVSLFDMPPASLSAGFVQGCDERNTSLFERTQEGFDGLVTELKDCMEGINISAEEMLSSLCQELEIHGARQEWGEHESVQDLVNAEIRPGLQRCLDHVTHLVHAVTDVRNRQEEAQQEAMKRLIEFFRVLAAGQAALGQGMQRVGVEYRDELEDCKQDHEEACEQTEKELEGLHSEMQEEAHHEALNELKEQTFAKLLGMEQSYRAHAEELMAIHRRYPETVANFLVGATEAFCKPLGLATEAGPEAEAAAAAGEVPREWPEGAEVGCKVLERYAPPELRTRLLAGDAPAAAEEPAAVAPPAAEDAAGAAAEEPPAEGAPRLEDCTVAVELLGFKAAWLEEPPWLEERLAGARSGVFQHLAGCRKSLDCVDVEECCEEVRRELYQRLSRHTNRKGEVQVEWYMPRHGVITKHKEKFERHLADIARKNLGHDDRAAELEAELEAAESKYQGRLTELEEQLPEAETLPALSALQRRAADEAGRFQEQCARVRKELKALATKAPEALRKESNAFLAAAEDNPQGRERADAPPLERYGSREVAFYRGELEQLGGQLQAKAEQRAARLEELEASLEERQSAPLAAFQRVHEEAESNLCASKGYGKEHGQPRRRARGAYRGLAEAVSRVRERLPVLLQHLAALCELPAAAGDGAGATGPVAAAALPESAPLRLHELLRPDPKNTWVFSMELLGVLYTIMCTLDALGTHLRAFKEEHAGQYHLENLPMVRLLCEEEEAVTAENEEAELTLRRDCLTPSLGPLLQPGATPTELRCGEPYEAEVQAIVKQVHDTYASKGGTPDFMQTFLAKMQQRAERARQEACRDLRDWGDELREGTLLQLGDALFGELTGRCLGELRRSAEEAVAVTAASWAQSRAERARHERGLNPGLSNPNAEKELLALVNAEAERHKAALACAKGDRVRLAESLREQASAFVARLAARFGAALRVLDRLPLHGHFLGLPGDEHAEPPRPSVKRRMRRLRSGTADAGLGDGLPPARFEGLPQHELRAALSGGAWPADPLLAELPPEAVQTERTPAVESFRSPVHKKLAERRKFYYDQYKVAFLAEVGHREAELTAREEREQAGQRNWRAMVRQLQPDMALVEVEEEQAPEEPPAPATPAAPAAKASPASKAAAKTKPGKK